MIVAMTICLGCCGDKVWLCTYTLWLCQYVLSWSDEMNQDNLPADRSAVSCEDNCLSKILVCLCRTLCLK